MGHADLSLIPTFLFGVQKARCMIDTGASVSLCSQKVLDNLKTHTHLKHQVIKTYTRKLVVALGDGSTARAEEDLEASGYRDFDYATSFTKIQILVEI
jgi:hypothetical protein